MAVVLMLCSCAPTAAPLSTAPSASHADAVATPTPSTSTSDLAFTLSADFTVAGSTARVTEAVHAPSGGGDDVAMSALDASAECANWRVNAPAPSFLRVDVTVSTEGAPWPAPAVIGVDAGSPPIGGVTSSRFQSAVAWEGDQRGAQTPCDSFRWIDLPGSATAYVGTVTGNAWDSWDYGLVGRTGTADDAPGIAFTGCAVQIGPAGRTASMNRLVAAFSGTGSCELGEG